MQPLTHAYWLKILDEFCPETGRVLEIGTPNDSKNSLLSYLTDKDERNNECFGIDMRADEPDSDVDLPYTLINCNSNNMDQFDDVSFDFVMTSSTLEHDRYFWKTLSEVRRVLTGNGLFLVMVPGYNKGVGKPARISRRLMYLMSRVDQRAFKGSFSDRLGSMEQNGFFVRTQTFSYHGAPGDYYRFSEDAFREVFMEGFECLHFDSILNPPRLVAVGRKL